MSKVDFLIIGTQKGGTTALHNMLSLHPKVNLSSEKELHYFDNEKRYNSKELFEYHNHFNFEEGCITGESTPAYLYYESCPQRIWKYNPNIKLIILLRNPIKRAYSHWNMNKKLDWVEGEFTDVFTLEEASFKKSRPFQDKRHSYLERGYYTEQLRRYYRFFPKQNIHIVKSEDFFSNTSQELMSIYDFLGLKSNINIDFDEVNIHNRSYASKMSSKEFRQLKHIYKFEIKQLERMLGWDCSDWLEE